LRRVETRVAEERLGIIGVAAKAVCGTDAGQIDFARLRALEIKDSYNRPRVLHVRGNDSATNQVYVVQYILGLANHFAPALGFGLVYIDRDQSILRCAIIRAKVKFVTNVANERVVMIETFDQRHRFEIRVGQILVGDLVTVIGADRYCEDQVLAIVGHGAARPPIGVLGRCVRYYIFFLRRANPVEIDLHVLVQRLKFRFF